MKNKVLIKLLTEVSACTEAVEWIKKDKLTLKQAWDKCERADWLIWFAAETKMATHQEIVLVACDCAETALKYVPKGEDRPRLAIKAARRWAKEPTAHAAYAAYAAAHAAYAAADPAYVAGAATYVAGAAACAAYAAADAAHAAAHAADAAYIAGAAAGAAAQKQLCKIVRDRIKPKEPR
jgi:hypothetical protein